MLKRRISWVTFEKAKFEVVGGGGCGAIFIDGGGRIS
jgi:hypothetical protein